MPSEIYVTCPEVGDGNPSMAMGIANILEESGYGVRRFFFQESAFFARVWHRRMSKSPTQADDYTKSGGKLRHLARYPLGVLSAIEFIAKNPDLLYRMGGHRLLFSVQEHPFGAVPKSTLQHYYANCFFAIPDVEPKKSGVEIARDKGLTPLVWNMQAFESLSQQGLKPELIAPVLPYGFKNGSGLGNLSERVVVKTSGSGAPEGYLKRMEAALKKMGVDYAIYTPNLGSREERVKRFYKELIANPPTVLIAPPTEMIQVGAVLNQDRGTRLVLYNVRGEHEQVSFEWARRMGIVLETLDLSSAKEDVCGKLRSALSARPQAQSRLDGELGTKSIAELTA